MAQLLTLQTAKGSSKQYIVNAGGIDGSFGGGTGNAVRAFQTDAKRDWLSSMSVDGIAGDDTWASVAHYLSQSGQLLKYGGQAIMKTTGSVLKYYTYGALGATFHTINGRVPEYN